LYLESQNVFRYTRGRVSPSGGTFGSLFEVDDDKLHKWARTSLKRFDSGTTYEIHGNELWGEEQEEEEEVMEEEVMEEEEEGGDWRREELEVYDPDLEVYHRSGEDEELVQPEPEGVRFQPHRGTLAALLQGIESEEEEDEHQFWNPRNDAFSDLDFPYDLDVGESMQLEYQETEYQYPIDEPEASGEGGGDDEELVLDLDKLWLIDGNLDPPPPPVTKESTTRSRRTTKRRRNREAED